MVGLISIYLGLNEAIVIVSICIAHITFSAGQTLDNQVETLRASIMMFLVNYYL